MSATSELILSQIQEAEEMIQTLEALGVDASQHRQTLKRLNEQFQNAKQALNESHSILKG